VADRIDQRPTSVADIEGLGAPCFRGPFGIALDLVDGPTDRHGLHSLEDPGIQRRAELVELLELARIQPVGPGSVLEVAGRRPATKSVTLVHSGEGREVMTRPLGPTKVSSVLASPDMAQPLLCTTPW
jgi:hypothetical protein